MRYRRSNTEGGTYFFTVNLADRQSGLLVRHIGDLHAARQAVKTAHSFSTVAMVVQPEHLHAVWRLPPGNADYSLRWSQNKAGLCFGSTHYWCNKCGLYIEVIPATRTLAA